MITENVNKDELNEIEISIIKYISKHNGCTSSELIENFNTNIYDLSNLINNMLIIKFIDKFVLTGKGRLFMDQYYFNKKVSLKTLRF